MRKIVLIVLFIVTVLNVCAQTQPSDTCGPCTLPNSIIANLDGVFDTRNFIHTDCDTLNMREHGSQYLLPYSFSSTTLDVWESSWPVSSWEYGEIPKNSQAAMIYTKYQGVYPDIYGDMCPTNAANKIWDFAQPYHTDTTINIIGVAAMMGLSINASSSLNNYLLEIRDTTLDTIYRTYHLKDFFNNPDWAWRSTLGQDSCYQEGAIGNSVDPVPQYYEMFFDTSLYISGDFYVVVNMKNDGLGSFCQNLLVYSYASRAAEERAPLIMGYDSVWASVDTIPYNTYGWHGFCMPSKNVTHDMEEVTETIGAFALFPILGVVADTTQTDTNSYLPQMTLEKYTYIFPNPANDVVNIASSFGMQSVEIYNIAGEKVEEMTDIKANNIELNISKYTPSTYIARIHTKHGSIDKKFVKK